MKSAKALMTILAERYEFYVMTHGRSIKDPFTSEFRRTNVGQAIMRLSPKERELLSTLKSDDLKDQGIPDRLNTKRSRRKRVVSLGKK